jgi:uncharacterized coiled-coil protein SlyX
MDPDWKPKDIRDERIADLEARLADEDKLNQIIAGHRDDYKKENAALRARLREMGATDVD